MSIGRACIVCNGEPLPEQILRGEIRLANLSLASDGGLAQFAAAGIQPDILVGDMDSLDDASLRLARPREVLDFPQNKGKSDTEIAVDVALDRGASTVVLLSATGRRIDHLFSNLVLLAKYAGRLFLYDGEFTVFALDSSCSSCSIDCRSETLFSVFAFGESVKRLTIEGAKWEVTDIRLDPCSLGLSNESAGGLTRVKIGGGILLVFARCATDHLTLTRSSANE